MSELRKTIIVAPLDWGYGHATRMLSVVRWLSEQHEVYVAIPGKLHFLFKNEKVKIFAVPGINIRYNRMPLMLSLFFQLPKVLIRLFFTKMVINNAIKRINPDLIISDNQPAAWHKKVTSVYVTHQLNIQHKNSVIKRLLNYVHHKYINRFDECWVPDTDNHDFAGELSKGKLKVPVKYIGGLSRFQTTEEIPSEAFRKVCILSGPEPEKSRWANQMKKAWKNDERALIIGMLHGKDRFEKLGELTLSSHLNDGMFMSILKQADEIISRSGYSTIMDLAYLGKKAALMPTKGQTEQEYLAGFHKQGNLKNENLYIKNEVVLGLVNELIC